MKRLFSLLLVVCLMLGVCSGCGTTTERKTTNQVLATTYPVYSLCKIITKGVDEENLSVALMITEQVSCIHDYSLTTVQMEKLERAGLVVLSGADMEEFMEDALQNVPEEKILDSSAGISVLPGEEDGEADPHIWLDPERYAQQCQTIADGLSKAFPAYEAQFQKNAEEYVAELLNFKKEALNVLSALDSRELITFHDGFAYFAEAFDLNLLAAIEVEDGASPSAKDIKEISELVRAHGVPAIFEERFANEAAHLSATTVAGEAPCEYGTLDMFMGADDEDYLATMQENISSLLRYLSWE